MNPEENFYPANLPMENELKKIKLMLEHGADFFYPENRNELPPEVEFEFLKHVEQFEKAFRQDKQITVFEFVGKPEYKKWDTIPPEDMIAELSILYRVLDENQIDLSTLCDVDPKELYRFITEELFLHEIEDIRIEGMMNCFIYEEFHPNHEYDIKRMCSNFFPTFLNLENDYYNIDISEDSNLLPLLENFRKSFDSFSFDSFLIHDLIFDTQKAKLTCRVKFSGVFEGSHELQYFDDDGVMDLVFEGEYWNIKEIGFPFLTVI